MPDWYREVRRAGDRVEAWLRRIDSTGLTGPPGAPWNDKDLLGHLAAWSNLLIDQVEALVQEPPQSLAAVDVNAWNAEQVASRAARPPSEIVEEWRSSLARALSVARSLPADAHARRARVSWAREPVSVGDVLSLWVAHVEQHAARLR